MVAGWTLVGGIAVGCSNVRSAYNFADSFVLQQVDALVSLTEPQRSLARRLVRQELRRALITGFPKFVALNQQHFRLLENPQATVKDFERMDEEVRHFMFSLLPPVAPALSEFLFSLNESQRTQLNEALQRRFDALARRLKTPEARRAESEKRFQTWAGWTVGKLDYAEQHMWVTNALSENQYPWTQELHNRSRMIYQWSVAAKTPDTLRAFIQKACKDPLSLRSPEYAQAIELWQAKIRPTQWKVIQTAPAAVRQEWIQARKLLLQQVEEIWKEESGAAA